MQMRNMPEIMTNLIISTFNRYEGKNNKLSSRFVSFVHFALAPYFGVEREQHANRIDITHKAHE